MVAKKKKASAKKLTKKAAPKRLYTERKALTKMRNLKPRSPDSYTTFDKLVAEGSAYGTVLAAPKTFTDARGTISNILTAPCGSVVLITSEPNTVRANHWHKEDAHLCYVVSGSVHYYERAVGSTDLPDYVHIKAGQSFITGPNREHAMKFTERTVFLTLGKLSRTPKEYEADLVRLTIPLASPTKDVPEKFRDPMLDISEVPEVAPETAAADAPAENITPSESLETPPPPQVA